jgi:flagellar FliJ protein
VSRRTFRLAGVLRLRRLEEDVAQARLVEAQRELHRAREAAARRLAELQGRQLTAGLRDARAFLADAQQGQRHALAVQAAWASAHAAQELRAQRRSELVAASMRVAALERLEERVAAERLELDLQAEGRELDDLVTTRHGRNEKYGGTEK